MKTSNYFLFCSIYFLGIKIQKVITQTQLIPLLLGTITSNTGITETVTVTTTSISTKLESDLNLVTMNQHININLPNIINRSDWGAREPKLIENFNGPAPYVIIHHSYIPGSCDTTENCKKAMRSMQDFHQIDRKWNDIGYSFAIGGDGNIYFGRGFNVIGAHAPNYNSKSVGICLIGDWRTELPSEKMLKAVHTLIDYGIKNGYIEKDYELYGHRQVRKGTECPGDRLFNEISKWPHFLSRPKGLRKNEI